MLVHVEVAASFEFQIEATMMREQLKHVIEKANAGRNLVSPMALDRERHLDVRLLAQAFDAALSHSLETPDAIASSCKVSSSAVSRRSVCVRGPRVIRTQP